MKKLICMTACLLALTIALCGAGFAEEKNPSGLLATVNGVDVPIDDAYTEYSYYAAMYNMYGMADQLPALREDITKYYIQLELIFQKFDELKMEYDEAAILESAETEYRSAIESYQTYIPRDGKTGEQILREAEDLLIEDGYPLSYFEKYARDNFRLNAVLKHFTGDFSVTDEEVRAYFDELAAADRALYEDNIAYYEQASQYGERILYVPEGFRRVKHILILLSEADQDAMYDLEAQMKSIDAALAADGADTATLTADKAALQEKIDAVFASIEPEAQNIMDKLIAGEDFIALMEAYGEDPGMQAEPNRTQGYLVHAESAQWVTPFRDAAMALEKPGDISQPVRTSYGLHIIRYESDEPAGPADYESFRDELRGELLDVTINNYYNDLIGQWYDASEITVYPENFDAQPAE